MVGPVVAAVNFESAAIVVVAFAVGFVDATTVVAEIVVKSVAADFAVVLTFVVVVVAAAAEFVVVAGTAALDELGPVASEHVLLVFAVEDGIAWQDVLFPLEVMLPAPVGTQVVTLKNLQGNLLVTVWVGSF